MSSSSDPHFQRLNSRGRDMLTFSRLPKNTSLLVPASFSNLMLIFLEYVENSFHAVFSSSSFLSAPSLIATLSTPALPRSLNALCLTGIVKFSLETKILKRYYQIKAAITLTF